MNDFPSLSEFLRKAGVSKETPKVEINALKKEHSKAYQAWYHKHQRKKDTRRYTLRFNKTEWIELMRAARIHNPSDFPEVGKRTDLAPFIKLAVLAYISKQYVPRDPRPMNLLLQELRVVGNALHNMIDGFARMQHNDQSQNLLTVRYGNLLEIILRLEQEFTAFMHSPPLTLKQALKEYLEARPEKVGQLIEYLHALKEQVDAGNKKHVP